MHFAFVLGRESEVVIFCVKLPHQNRLLGGPGGVSLPDILRRDWLITEAIGVDVRSEGFVNAPKNGVDHLSYLFWDPLASGGKVVQVDIYLVQGVPLLIGGGLRPLFVIGRFWKPVFKCW